MKRKTREKKNKRMMKMMKKLSKWILNNKKNNRLKYKINLNRLRPLHNGKSIQF